MEVRQYNNAKNFLENIEEFLIKKEAVHNLPLGLLYRLASAKEMDSDQPEPFLAVVESEGSPALSMIMTPPKNLIISGDGPNVSKAIQTAVSFLKKSDLEIPGVIGERKLAEEFADEWLQQNGGSLTIQMEQRIYKLENLNAATSCNGYLRAATESDHSLVSDWIHAFSVDANEPMSKEEAYEHAERVIHHGTIYLWEDGKIVSMAGKSRPTKNGSTVSLVYTPPKFRKRGYASTCVAALSRLILDEGYQFCSLYTDLANPTSNSIYMKMGYQPVTDSIVYQFCH